MKVIIWLMCGMMLMVGLVGTAAASSDYGVSAEVSKRVFTKHFSGTFFDITKNAEFSIEILPDDAEYKKLGKGVVGIVIHDARNHDVEKAAVAIRVVDLDAGRQEAGTPVVKERGDGLYTVSGLDLKKKGRWRLAITVTKDGVEDGVEFLFPDALKSRWPAGLYNP
jgi:hypothetical protein